MKRCYSVAVVRVDAELAAKIGEFPLRVASPAGKDKIIFTIEGEKGTLQSQVMSRNVASRKWLELCAIHELTHKDLRGFTLI